MSANLVVVETFLSCLQNDDCVRVVFGGQSYLTFTGPVWSASRSRPELVNKCFRSPFPRVFENASSPKDALLVPISKRPSRITLSSDAQMPPLRRAVSRGNRRSVEPPAGLDPEPITRIERDSHGRRIDPPVQHTPYVTETANKHLCNNYHLRMHCNFGRMGTGCRYVHGHVDQRELEALRYIARGRPCRNGPECDDEWCYAGHHCPFNPCHRNCEFQPWQHYRDWHEKEDSGKLGY